MLYSKLKCINLLLDFWQFPETMKTLDISSCSAVDILIFLGCNPIDKIKIYREVIKHNLGNILSMSYSKHVLQELASDLLKVQIRAIS